MPDNRPFSQWEASSLPVIAFAPTSHAVLYHNPAAARLEPGGLIAGLPSEERAALLSALDGQSGDPVFLHAGGEVYSPLMLPAGGCTLCLFQAVTGYYNRTRDALDQALMRGQDYLFVGDVPRHTHPHGSHRGPYGYSPLTARLSHQGDRVP